MPQPEDKPTSNSIASTATITGPAAAAALKTELAAIEWPKEGTVVEATLMKKMPRKAYFDMGRFGTGIVFGMEMVNAKEAIRGLAADDKVSAKIIALDGEEGHIELSLTEAGRQKLWQQAKELAESGEVVKAKIMSANAGGLMAAITGGGADGSGTGVGSVSAASGLMAFLPVSQLSLEHYPKVQDGDRVKIADELRKFVGQELSVKIIDANPRNQKIIVSEREVLATNVKELLGAYTVGQLIDCIVSGVADFGVFVRFVDNPQIEGMIHISELDYKLIENPKDVVKVNDQLQAKIIDIKEGKVFLSLKALKADPWTGIETKFKTGDAVEGRVHKFNPFGAVVALDGDLQGMVHISEFGGQDEMKKALEIGKSYAFVIDAIKPEEKRITLKMKK